MFLQNDCKTEILPLSLNEQKSKQNSSLEMIEQPSPYDILCGKDKSFSHHPGNLIFRDVILSFQERYANANSKPEKMQITKEIVQMLQATYNSRFIKLKPQGGETQVWGEISDQAARDKVSHALRFASRWSKSSTKQATSAELGALDLNQLNTSAECIQDTSCSSGESFSSYRKHGPTVSDAGDCFSQTFICGSATSITSSLSSSASKLLFDDSFASERYSVCSDESLFESELVMGRLRLAKRSSVEAIITTDLGIKSNPFASQASFAPCISQSKIQGVMNSPTLTEGTLNSLDLEPRHLLSDTIPPKVGIQGCGREDRSASLQCCSASRDAQSLVNSLLGSDVELSEADEIYNFLTNLERL